MKHVYLLLLALVAVAIQGQAQTKKINGIRSNIVRCYTVENINQYRASHSGAETDAQFEAWLKQKSDERKTERVTVQTYVLPIVFHIINTGETAGIGSNVSQALIQEQMLQLNKDYANLSNSPYAVSAKTGIQFVLAQNDTLGHALAEPGIDRINYKNKSWTAPGTNGWTNTYITNTIKPQSIWNPNQYINVWIVPAMNNGGTGKLLGFSTFPSSSTLSGLNNDETAKTAGCVIDYTSVGSLFRPSGCDISWGKGKTLSHELGHFFGLRHIWGDATCGNDYVDDTPIHEDANSGIPIHPKPNSCGTADEMFENYMDYSDDEILNTFTADQVDRMQTVMLNSPRRVSLPSSTVGFVTVSGSNKVKFISCSGAINTTETGTNGIYPRYKDILLDLNVDYQATSAATVTVQTTGTATALQYQVLTPTVTFAAGDSYKPIIIRLIDNAAVDGERSIDVSYTISGPGVVADTASQVMTINVSDDDNLIFAGQSKINILDEHFENGTSSSGIPAGWGSLLSTGYPNVFVASTNGDAGGSGKAAHITNDRINKPNVYTKGLDGAAELESPEINPLQYQSIDSIQFKYKIKGSSKDHGYLLYDIGDGYLYFWGAQGFSGSGPYYGSATTVRSASPKLAAPSTLQSQKFTIAFYWETDTAKTGGDPGFNIDDVILTAHPYGIETSVSASNRYDVEAGSDNRFRSTNNKVIASLTDASTDVSGLQAGISQAGNDIATVVSGSSVYRRTQKVLTLMPATTNTTTSYTATFYFTSAEMAAWGADAANLKILKVADGVDLSSNITSDNAVIVTPTSVDDRLSTEGYIAYTATFTGFSQFTLVEQSAVLPLTWLSFDGVLKNNVATLTWKTGSETNSQGFDVQRSTDGKTFEKIGWVKSQNGVTNSYSFDDINVLQGAHNYYRLKQTDYNGRVSYSPIVDLYAYGIAKWLKLHPNPVKDKLLIDFSNITSQKATLLVTDASGKVVYRSQALVQGHVEIATAAWSKGVYIVKVETDDNTASFKVVKE